jgi:KaiC/GvpD/RAD55 family RecA-like ATPase
MYSMTHLVTKSLGEGDVSYLRKIRKELITNPIDAGHVDWIFEYITRYNTLPTTEAFTDFHPTFIEAHANVALGYIYEAVVDDLRRVYVATRLGEAKDQFDPVLIKEIADVIAPIIGNQVIYNDIDPAMYFAEQRTLECKIPFIKENLGKIVSSDFLLFVGRMKEQKTHITRLVLLDLLSQGYNIILFTNEISPIEYAAQLDALVASQLGDGFNSMVFRTFDADDSIRAQLRDAAAYRREHMGTLTISSAVRSVSEFYAAVSASPVKVDAIFVDGMHLMGGAASTTGDKSQSLRTISNDTKMFCISQGIPVIAVSQSGRGREGQAKATTGTIALSDAFAQDATVVYDCQVRTDLDFAWLMKLQRDYGKNATIAQVTPIVNRAGNLKPFAIFTNWDRTRVTVKKIKERTNDEFDLDAEDIGTVDESEDTGPDIASYLED